MRKKLLFVEDEEALAKLVAMQLKHYDFEIDYVLDGDQARQQIQEQNYDLILLDRLFPEGSGLSFLTELRQTSKVPVIFVTALSAPESIIEGLEAGADDYITKPFDERVLVSRIRSVLRRSQMQKQEGETSPFQSSDVASAWVSVGPLELNSQAFEARLKDSKLSLTRSEFLLLDALVSQQGCVLTRQQLIQIIQGDEVNVTGRTVDTHVFGLRKKLGAASDLIETIRGVGYRLHRDEDQIS